MTMCVESKGCLARLLHECERSKLRTTYFSSKHVNGCSVSSALFFPSGILSQPQRAAVMIVFPYSQKEKCWNTGPTEDKRGLDQKPRRAG